MQEKYVAHLEAIKERMGEVENELFDWWEKCHFTEAEKRRFQRVSPGLFSLKFTVDLCT